MKKTVFTLCSNNYLSQAKILFESLIKFNPDFEFVIGLVDKKSNTIDYPAFIKCEIIEIESIFEDYNVFLDMYSRYNITEINTAVKPFFFKYLLDSCQENDQVYYFDPDIEIFHSLIDLVTILEKQNVVLTPHLLSPIFDDSEAAPSESYIINAGLYNLGFMGLKKCEESLKLINWWSDKCEKNCYIDMSKGIFVDQSWISHAPIFFEGVHILRSNNYNVAYWNLHERVVKKENGKYYVNGEFPLVFFHFSGYNPLNPDILAKYQHKYDFTNMPLLKSIFDEYASKLMGADYNRMTRIKCYYVSPITASSIKIKIKKFIKKSLVFVLKS